MTRWQLTLTLTVTLGIGFTAGSLMTRQAQADTIQSTSQRYSFIRLERLSNSDPIALRGDGQTGDYTIIPR